VLLRIDILARGFKHFHGADAFIFLFVTGQ